MEKEKRSGFGLASMVLGIIGLLTSCILIGIVPAILALIFSIIGLREKNKSHAMSIVGLSTSVISIVIFFIFLMIVIFSPSTENASTNTEISTENVTQYTEIQKETEDIKEDITEDNSEITDTSKETEITTEEETTEEVTEISSDDFKVSCQEFDYNTIARNPDDYIGQNFVVTVEIFDVISESSWFSDYEKYYKAWTDDGSGWYMDHMIYLVDYQDENSSEHLNILEGDVVKVYGTFNGMIPTTNSLNGTNSEEIGLDIKYAELISE